MAQDVADDLGIGAGVDLSRGMAVSQHVPAEQRCGDASRTGVMSYQVTDSRPGERSVRYAGCHEQLSRHQLRRPPSAQVGGDGTRNRRQQGQRDGDPGLGAAHAQDACDPIHILEAQRQDLAGAKP